MLPVDSPVTPWVVGVVLVGIVAILVVRAVHRDRREYGLFKRLSSTTRRQKMLRKWVFESFAWLGGSSLVLLALVWPSISLLLNQVDRWPLVQGFQRSLATGSGLLPGFLVGAGIAFVAVLVLPILFLKSQPELRTLGDVHALLPRNRAELKYGWVLSINAGVVEELLFRLAMPAAIFAVFGNALVAILASLVVFGGLHIYQGIGGVIGTFIIGAVLMAVYLATGSILWPILAHALFDLRSLVLIPMVANKVHRIVPS